MFEGLIFPLASHTLVGVLYAIKPTVKKYPFQNYLHPSLRVPEAGDSEWGVTFQTLVNDGYSGQLARINSGC
jgi:hypothetical protein